jgi:spermidine synthase
MTGALHSLVGAPSPQILSIGLGSGQLPLTIEHQIPGAKQTVVELSQSVVDAAGCFGGGNFQIVQADGRSFLERSADQRYDAILVDVADGYDRVPSCFTTLEFFHTVKRTLQTTGILLMNVHTGKTLHNDLKDILPAVKKTFGEVQLGQAPGLANAIIMSRMKGDESATEKHSSHDDATLLAWYADAAFHDVRNGLEASDNSNADRTDAQVNCN